MPRERSLWGIHDWDHGSDAPSGCGWYRVILPLSAMAEHGGWRVGMAPGRPPEAAGGFSLLTAQRLDKPGVIGEWRKLRLRHRLAYELDDDVWSISKMNWAAYNTYNRGNVLDIMAHAAQIADLVTVTTDALAEVVRAHTAHPNIRVLPNCVPDGVLDIPRPRREPGGPVTVGWAGGSSHAMDTAMVAIPVHQFLSREPRARLHIVGTDFRKTFGWRMARYTPWVPSDASLDYYRACAPFDIALCPLTGTEFDQSKSAIKAVEAMALGIPVLASDTGPYRDVVVDGVTGYLIRQRSEWGRRLRELTHDDAARQEMGAKAREAARAYTIGANWRRWSDAFSELL